MHKPISSQLSIIIWATGKPGLETLRQLESVQGRGQLLVRAVVLEEGDDYAPLIESVAMRTGSTVCMDKDPILRSFDLGIIATEFEQKFILPGEIYKRMGRLSHLEQLPNQLRH